MILTNRQIAARLVEMTCDGRLQWEQSAQQAQASIDGVIFRVGHRLGGAWLEVLAPDAPAFSIEGIVVDELVEMVRRSTGKSFDALMNILTTKVYHENVTTIGKSR